VTGFSKRKLISSALLINAQANIGFYVRRSMSAFGGKADMAIALQMSSDDPKPILGAPHWARTKAVNSAFL
jgi:hypothetical protein